MDEFVDELLNEERVCDIILPRITKRDVLEDTGEIGPRKSRLLDAMEGKEEDEDGDLCGDDEDRMSVQEDHDDEETDGLGSSFGGMSISPVQHINLNIGIVPLKPLSTRA